MIQHPQIDSTITTTPQGGAFRKVGIADLVAGLLVHYQLILKEKG
jgi:hypothetical protein